MHPLDRVVVVDTETGGLDPLTHSILSIGLVSGDRRQEAQIFVAEPGLVITEQSFTIHRLGPEFIDRNGVSPCQAADAIDAFFRAVGDDQGGEEKLMVCGHNVSFDLGFLRRLYSLAGRPLPERFGHRTLDTHTLLWSLEALGRIPPGTTPSDAAFRHFGITPPDEHRHTALGDARATLSLLEKLLELV